MDKVSSGEFHSRMSFLKLPGITLYREHWNSHMVVRGSPPGDMVMLGTSFSPSNPTRWCGQALDDQVFACSWGAQDIDFVMPADTRDVVLLMDPGLFEQALGPSAVESIKNSRHLALDRADGAGLVNTMNALINWTDGSREAAGGANTVDTGSEIRSRLLLSLATCFDDNQTADLGPDACTATLDRALQHIESCQGKTTALDLALHAGVSQRTLETLFRREFGITPGRFLNTTRLNGCYHDLYHAHPGEDTVTRIATRWGFSHMGRFSGAYQRQFGELPSNTLGKVDRSAVRAQLAP